MQNEVIKQLFERKSVRLFQDKPIEEQEKKLIIESAIQAPTAGNMSLYSIIDVTDEKLKQKLSQTCDNQPFIAKAAMILIFVADYQKWYDSFNRFYGEEARTPSYGDFLLAMSDALIAAQNAVVAAQSMGIGSCYIGDILEQYEEHKALLKLPKYTAPVAMLCFGYPTDQQKERIKPKRFDEKFIVSQNEYQHLNYEQLDEMFEEKNRAIGNDKTARSDVDAIFKRKWNVPFIEEMTRSSKMWIEQWAKNEAGQ